jgi:hypothetical protein
MYECEKHPREMEWDDTCLGDRINGILLQLISCLLYVSFHISVYTYIYIIHNFSRLFGFVKSSLKILQTCFAALSIADVDFPRNKSTFGRK